MKMVEKKICSKCGEEKPIGDFSKDSHKKSGFRSHCKGCCKKSFGAYYSKDREGQQQRSLEYYWKNRDKALEKNANWRSRNPDKAKLATRRWKQENKESQKVWQSKYQKSNRDKIRNRVRITRARSPEKYKEKSKKWARENPEIAKEKGIAWRKSNHHRLLSICAKRRAYKKRATVSWADMEKVRSLYKLSQDLSKETGITHHVDHIVPINSEYVCGLHWEGNLQVIPYNENITKSNKVWPNMGAINYNLHERPSTIISVHEKL
jgi:hypothetical protein